MRDERSHHTRTQTQTVTTAGAQIVAGTDLSVTAGGDITLQAAHLSGRAVTLTAAGQVAFLAGHDFSASQVSGTSTGLLTRTILDHGHSDDSLVYTTIDGTLTIRAAGVTVEYESGQEVQTGTGKKARIWTQANAADGDASPAAVVTGLSAQAGLGWMAQVAQGSAPVTYVGLTTHHRSWDNDKTVLSPAAQALIAVAVVVATQGLATSLFSTAMAAVGESLALSGSTLGAFTSTATAAAVGATSSLVSGTIIGAINGDLNVGSLFLNAAIAGATAGAISFANTVVLPQIGDALGLQPMTMASDGHGGLAAYGLGNPQSLTSLSFDQIVRDGFAKLIVDTPIRAAIASLTGGGSFGKAFLSSLRIGLATDVIQPALFFGVGDLGVSNDPDLRLLFGEGSAGKVFLHAAVGAAGGYLIGGERGALGGALGAALSAALLPLIASGIDRNDPNGFSKLNNASRIIGGLGSLFAGDTTMSGSTSAQNGFQYNYLNHQQAKELAESKRKLNACIQDGGCTTDEVERLRTRIAELDKIDTDTNVALLTACSAGTRAECAAALNVSYTALKTYRDDQISPTERDDPDYDEMMAKYQALNNIRAAASQILTQRNNGDLTQMLRGFDFGALGGASTAVATIAAAAGVNAAGTIIAVCGTSSICYSSYLVLLVEDIAAGITEFGGTGIGTGAFAKAVWEAGSIRNINKVGGKQNCVNWVVATDSTLSGNPASALDGGPFSISVLEDWYKSSFGNSVTIDQISDTMISAGSGARGIVFGSRGDSVGHVFNVVNQGGAVRYLDGQTGSVAKFDGYKSFYFMRTN